MTPEQLKQFYAERNGLPVIIPQYERCDGNFPPAWLVRRMTQRIDRTVK